MIVACIIPVRNMAGTVAIAIDSAIAAGCDEVVVVDDCSTDDTPMILAEYGSRITAWRWPKKPSNWVSALRVVYDATKADYFISLGADDRLLPAAVDAIRFFVDAPVIFTDYAVVSPAGGTAWTIEQGVVEPTRLAPDQMKSRVQSERNATETGIGSGIRRDVADWLFATQFEEMGPVSDSVGYATAACLRGCAMHPGIGAEYTYTEKSYGREHGRSEQETIEIAVAAIRWMQSVGLDEDTTRRLAEKRCGVRF